MVDTGILSNNMKYLSLANVKWQSQPMRRFTNFMTFIPIFTFTEMQVIVMQHLRWMWHAIRECLLIQHMVPSPFGTYICFNR